MYEHSNVGHALLNYIVQQSCGLTELEAEITANPRERGGGTTRTYFASCIAASTMDETKRVPSFSRPVRVVRN